MPWALIFVDLITFDFRVRGNKAHLLVADDLVTDGVRVRPVKRNAEIGDEWDKIVTMESLHAQVRSSAVAAQRRAVRQMSGTLVRTRGRGRWTGLAPEEANRIVTGLAAFPVGRPGPTRCGPSQPPCSSNATQPTVVL